MLQQSKKRWRLTEENSFNKKERRGVCLCVCACAWMWMDVKPLAEAAGWQWRAACQLQERWKRRVHTSYSVSSWEERRRLRWGRRHWPRSHSGKKSPTLGVGGGWGGVAMQRLDRSEGDGVILGQCSATSEKVPCYITLDSHDCVCRTFCMFNSKAVTES